MFSLRHESDIRLPSFQSAPPPYQNKILLRFDRHFPQGPDSVQKDTRYRRSVHTMRHILLWKDPVPSGVLLRRKESEVFLPRFLHPVFSVFSGVPFHLLQNITPENRFSRKEYPDLLPVVPSSDSPVHSSLPSDCRDGHQIRHERSRCSPWMFHNIHPLLFPVLPLSDHTWIIPGQSHFRLHRLL